VLPTHQETPPSGREEVEESSPLLQRFIEHLRSHDRSEQTTRSYSGDLKLFARWFCETNREELTPQSITPIDLREYKRYLLEDRGLKPATVNRRLASISAFCKWGEHQGLADGNPCDEISIVPEVRTAPKWLAKREQYALIRAVQKANRPRDEALIMLMLHTGLRVGEVSTLHIGDVSISPGGTDTYPQMQLCVLWSLSLHEGRWDRPALALPKTREPKTRDGTTPLPSSLRRGCCPRHGLVHLTGTSCLEQFPGIAIPVFGNSPRASGGLREGR